MDRGDGYRRIVALRRRTVHAVESGAVGAVAARRTQLRHPNLARHLSLRDAFRRIVRGRCRRTAARGSSTAKPAAQQQCDGACGGCATKCLGGARPGTFVAAVLRRGGLPYLQQVGGRFALRRLPLAGEVAAGYQPGGLRRRREPSGDGRRSLRFPPRGRPERSGVVVRPARPGGST